MKVFGAFCGARPEIAPRRRGGRRVKEFLIKKYSELRELCASVVNTL
jgi:hypothetical protein